MDNYKSGDNHERVQFLKAYYDVFLADFSIEQVQECYINDFDYF